MKDMIIIGAGMAGLIAANVFRKHNPVIFEAQENLPDNHTALLRHKTNIISAETSIPFRKVNISKEISFRESVRKDSTIALRNMYSQKVIGEYQNRSISNMGDEERYISPPDFVKRLSVGTNIKFSRPVTSDTKELFDKNVIKISTMPIMVLCKILGCENLIKDFEFKSSPIFTQKIKIPNCDLYQTIYYPAKSKIPYRISITGDSAIYESTYCDYNIDSHKTELYLCLRDHFGIDVEMEYFEESHRHSIMKYGKINKLKNYDQLKSAIAFLTKEYNIYSLGRFAIWRNILLDDVAKDVKVIQKLIESNGYYTGK